MRALRRRDLLAAGGAALLAGAAGATGTSGQRAADALLLLLRDHGDVAFLPYRLRRLIAGGIRFTSAISATPSPLAWHATLIHGRHAHELGAAGIVHDLWDPATTVGRVKAPQDRARALGYRHVVVDGDAPAERPDAHVPTLWEVHVPATATLAPSRRHRLHALLDEVAARAPLVIAVEAPPFSSGRADLGFGLVVAAPPPSAPGRSDALVSSVDILPTILSWFGHEQAVAALPGSSLLPLLSRPSAQVRDAVFVAQDFRTTAEYAPLRAIRTARDLLVFRPHIALPAQSGLRGAAHGRTPADGHPASPLAIRLHQWRIATGDRWLPESCRPIASERRPS